MGVPARAERHDHHHEDAHFDDTSIDAHDQKSVDQLARATVKAEANRDDGGDKKAEAKPTPPDAKVPDPVDPTLGKTVEMGGGTHKVTSADSLWSIAAATYGSGTYWIEIKKANAKKVHGPTNIIWDNDVLVLPVLHIPTLKAMKSLEGRPEDLRDLAMKMTDDEYKGFLAGLPAKDAEKNAALLQSVEMMRSTGMTFDEMADEQKAFVEAEAKKKGVSPGDYVKELIDKKGYGSGTAAEWNKNSPAQKKKWQDRFDKLVATIKSSAPADVKQIIKDAESHHGGFRWEPEQTEILGAFAYTSSGKWTLKCGTRFVEVGESDPSAVYANIAHEMGGHNYYGDTWGAGIQESALAKLPKEEQDKAESSGNSLHSAYGYQETEIFAELYEFRYDSDKNPTDHPFAVDAKGNDMTKTKKRTSDVKDKLERIKEAFAPKVAMGLVRGLARRVDIDPRIMPEAKVLFRADVKTVFGFDV